LKINLILFYLKKIFSYGDWGLGIGDWGLGIGDWGILFFNNLYILKNI
jgi:hypothetical protein